MKNIFAFVAISVLFFAVSCDSGLKFENPLDPNNQIADSTETGELGGECYPNETCNKGLVCDIQNNVCIKDPESANDDKDTGSTNNEEQNDAMHGNDDETELPDDLRSCPNSCSGFGTCDFETGKCTCDETHQGEDCSECKEGYHLEAEGDDEDGDPDIRSCVIDQTCDPNPCNNNGCNANGGIVKCTCSVVSHATGRWCDECTEGYLKSLVDGKCKPDCSEKTCEGGQKCGVDYTTNEASCNTCENEFYSGADCKSCDIAHFCGGEHANSCVVENGTEKCGCESGFVFSDNKCVKECDTTKCFQTFSCTGTLNGLEYNVPGHCNPSTCECDPGWVTGSSLYGEGETVSCTDAIIGLPLETRNNVRCTVCDEDNPPSEYASTGCPTDCGSNFCNGTDTANGQGSCYKEKETKKVYCKCASGYTMTGDSKYYDDNPTGMCE